MLSVEKMTAKFTYVVPGGGAGDGGDEEGGAVAAKVGEDDETKTPHELAGSIVLEGSNAVLAGAKWRPSTFKLRCSGFMWTPRMNLRPQGRLRLLPLLLPPRFSALARQTWPMRRRRR